ncbi:MAG: hypothetical protein Kow0029_15470 [Candidatus Rifleibacteriota bacterium]
MKIEIRTSRDTWNSCLDQFPDFPGKAYYRFEYCALAEANGEGKAKALYYKNETGSVFYPLLFRQVPEKLSSNKLLDLESPYGYGGPIFSNYHPDLINAFHKAHHDFCLETDIIAEFVRLNPFVRNHEAYQSLNCIESNRTTVQINVEGATLSDIYAKASPAKRRNLKKAIASGLTYRKCTPGEFLTCYLQTMKNLGADNYYLFSEEYFAALADLPEEMCMFRCCETSNGRIAAAAVFLLDETSMHYHLGGSVKELLLLRPNDFLMFKAAEEASELKKKLLHLGGGLTNHENDALFRFKKGFSNEILPFYIAKIIHQPQIYQQLSERWQKITGLRPAILLHYHYGV